jgi:hypothetical protein
LYYIVPNAEKLKSFVKTFTLHNQILFEERLCIPIWLFIFDTDKAELTVRILLNANSSPDLPGGTSRWLATGLLETCYTQK